jgi:GT2 family glycosyltransferase
MSIKSYVLVSSRRVLEDWFKESLYEARVEPCRIPGRWRIRYPIPVGMRLCIVIASGGNVDVLRNNLKSLIAKTDYSDYEIVIIDNAKHDRVKEFVDGSDSEHRQIRYIDWRHKPFNYSVINNTAARQCESPILLFLNDDTSVITPDWLTSMVELIARPEVGVVGAKLLYPDGRIQHAGVIMGLYDNCGHAFKGQDGTTQHYFDFPDVIRNVSAVTGACLMTRSDLFWQVGGFDETSFAVAFNDIDLCLKIGQAGYRVLYTPHAMLYHHEAFSKTQKDLIPHPAEVAEMQGKWSSIIEHDPYYNPNLTRVHENYAIR